MTKINDNELEQVNGGANIGLTQYDTYGTIEEYLGDNHYRVTKDDGVEVTASFDQRHIIDNGTKVALIPLAGGWAIAETY